MTSVKEPSGGGGPPTRLIVAGIVGALTLVFLVGGGVGQEWGAEQWGPVAAWVSGAATLAAVGVALWQASVARRGSMRLELARLVDHEVARRRECIKALGDLWAAIVGLTDEIRSFTDYLDNLQPYFNLNIPRVAEGSIGPSPRQELNLRFRAFYDEWNGAITPPLFVALAILSGTGVAYDALLELNEALVAILKDDGQQGGVVADIRKEIFAQDAQFGRGSRPDTKRLTAAWHAILSRRNVHLELVQKHFSLNRADVEKAVRAAT